MSNKLQEQNQTSANQAPVSPVSASNKEAENPVGNFITPSAEIEKIIKDKEVAAANVTEVVQAPELNQEHFQAGIKHAGPTTPVLKEPSGIIHLRMSEIEAKAAAKGNINDSKTWLARLVFRIFQKMSLGSTSG